MVESAKGSPRRIVEPRHRRGVLLQRSDDSPNAVLIVGRLARGGVDQDLAARLIRRDLGEPDKAAAARAQLRDTDEEYSARAEQLVFLDLARPPLLAYLLRPSGFVLQAITGFMPKGEGPESGQDTRLAQTARAIKQSDVFPATEMANSGLPPACRIELMTFLAIPPRAAPRNSAPPRKLAVPR